MKQLTLKHLRYFVALSQHGHFGRASQACAVSQPALSLQIKELEEMLGAALIERSGRRIRLTGLGDAFAERAETILRTVDELGDLVRASRDAFAGPFRLGVIPTIAPYLLPRVMHRITERFPKLDIQVRETVTMALVEETKAGRLDAALVALPISEPSLAEAPLFEEEFVLVRPVGDEGKPVPDGQALTEMRLLLLDEGHCFREQALSFCGLATVKPRDVMSGSSLTTLVQMVDAGLGVTLIPEMAIPVETRSEGVSIARFRDPKPSRRIGMVWRKTNPMEPALIEVSEVVRGAAETLSDDVGAIN